MNLQQRMENVEDSIQRACLRSGRDRNDVQVIAVTKYVALETAQEAMELGCQHVGESRWQEAAKKWEHLGHLGTWHFIGHLQTNKVRDIIGKFTYIHSLDRISLAKELDKRAAAIGEQVQCFLQVNVSGEETKHGLSPEELIPFARKMNDFPHIKVIGLMTMAPHEDDPEKTRPVFRRLRELKDELNEANVFNEPVTELSMGMSNDFEVAVEEGATWVRLGSILVGTQ